MSVIGKQVSDYVSRRIDRISKAPDSAARASMARLRRGVGKTPGAVPELWGEFLVDMPEECFSKYASGIPSEAEWAAYTALTLFALHQQGRDMKAEFVHQKKQSLGTAAAELVRAEAENEDGRKKTEEEIEKIRERVWRRFYQAASAADMLELSHYLRGMVQLFKAGGIGLDYGKLAEDLFYFQFPDRRDRVRLRWGEDFYRIRKTEGETDNGSKSVS